MGQRPCERDRGRHVNSGIFAGIGLAAACGWNSFLPLLVLALGDRITDGDLLVRPYDSISSIAGILLLLFLATIELVLDKTPRLDHAFDILGSVLRPGCAGLAMMAITQRDGSMHAILALLIGMSIGALVHWDKVHRRIHLAENGTGLGTPFVSMTEDFCAMVTAVSSLLLGILGPIVAFLSWLLIRATYSWGVNFGKRPRRSSQPAEANTLRR
jgi:hypothetical protein